MNRLRLAILLALLAVAGTAAAVLVASFKNWDELTTKSPDIIIARCTIAPKEGLVVNGMNWADIEVLSVLKGDTKTGAARMVSQYEPRQGERFLMFSTYQSNEHYRAYNATEDYRIVPLDRYFQVSEITGKPLAEQIQIVLKKRFEDVNRELDRATEEKKRLEAGLVK